MDIVVDSPLARAQAKCEQIEQELRKHLDFQFYLVCHSRQDRARMRRVLMEIPSFRLWRALKNAIEQAQRRCASVPQTAMRRGASVQSAAHHADRE